MDIMWIVSSVPLAVETEEHDHETHYVIFEETMGGWCGWCFVFELMSG